MRSNMKTPIKRIFLIPKEIHIYGYLALYVHFVIYFLISSLYCSSYLFFITKEKLTHFTLIRLNNIFFLGTNRFVLLSIPGSLTCFPARGGHWLKMPDAWE